MKESLKRHITNIFSSLHVENIPFNVYECGIDVLPKWTNQIQLTHEFLICCELFSNGEKLQKFLSKEIHQHENYAYWFEGDRIIEDEQPKHD
ncbi:MAG: hypothetical protein LBM08_13950, partial [Dysgonamonadaceae bacterium]|nr:hypothetical protein [Dysgonamonadaceae bacterium]